MTTATDWEPGTWTDTGSHAVVTDVTTLDGAATDTRFLPKVPGHIHNDLCRRVQPGEWAGEPTPQAGTAPDTEDLTRQIDLTMASYRLVLHQEAKAELWHEIASEAWAHQGATSRISESYTDRREALLAAYERECEAIKAGLRGRPEYGGHVYDEQRGFVATDEPTAARVKVDALVAHYEQRDANLAAEYPEGREGLDRMVKRVPTVISAQRPPRDTKGDVSLADYIQAIEAAEAVGVTIPPERQVQAESGDRLEPEGTVRASWWARLVAWFGGAR